MAVRRGSKTRKWRKTVVITALALVPEELVILHLVRKYGLRRVMQGFRGFASAAAKRLTWKR